MTKLFIANTTRQVLEFAYRMPEHNGVRYLNIPIASQQQIPGQLTTPDVEYILKQYEVYKIVNVDDIDRTKPFIGICYSIDKPIKVDKLLVALEHNHQVQIERGQQMRREAAVQANNAIDQTLMEQRNDATLKALELTVQEQRTPFRDADSGDLLEEGVTVDKNAPEREPPTVSRSRRPRRAA